MHQSSDSRFGLRFSGCFVGDLCHVREGVKKPGYFTVRL